MCVDTIMPTKCFTKATKQGKKYTACVDTKTFKKKGVKGNAKSKKPTAKGVMVVRKKIKTTRKLKNKSTIKPTLAKSKPKKAKKKMSAGMSVLMTSGLMSRIGKATITRKEKDRRIKVEETKRKRKIRRNITLAENIYIEMDNYGDALRARKGTKKTLSQQIKELKKRRDNIRGKEYADARTYHGFHGVANMIKEMDKLLEKIEKDKTRRAIGVYGHW